MADKFLNLTGIATIRDWVNGKFATKTAFDALSDEVEEIISEGGEPNVIETIKKNGTTITPDGNKAVDIPIPTVAKSGTGEDEKLTITDGQNAFDAPTVDAMESYVSEHGGVIQKVKLAGTELAIDSSDKSVNIPAASSSANGAMSSTDKAKLDGIEAGAEENVIETFKVNGTAQTVTNKEVDITVPEDLSDLTNNGQDPYAKVSDVEAAVVGALKPKGSVAFASLPALTAANLNNMYSVSDAFTATSDFVPEEVGKSYTAGTNVAIINTGTDQNPVYKYDAMPGSADMSSYWTMTTGMNNTLEPMTVAEINAVLEPTTP